MRIGIIGSGIAGLSAAWALRDVHEIVLFEADERAGGHANTILVPQDQSAPDGAKIAVDSGFIVFNTHNYPNLTAFFDHLGVESHETTMSFAFSQRASEVSKRLEWSSRGLRAMFDNGANLFSAKHWQMLVEIARFSLRAKAALKAGSLGDISLGDFLKAEKFSDNFSRNYLVPMVAAIWSCHERNVLDFEARALLRFFDNHRLLQIHRPVWRSVKGGSQHYVRSIADALGPRLRLGTRVHSARPEPQGTTLILNDRSEVHFDQIIFACHPDQARIILQGWALPAHEVLRHFVYSQNIVVVHGDTDLMPPAKRSWAAWNYCRTSRGAQVTYWMNALQQLDTMDPILVTLNPAQEIRSDKVFARIHYDHPQFNAAIARAQTEMDNVQGEGGIWFAGAWLGQGFHEDGLVSGLRVAQSLGARLPWSYRGPPLFDRTKAPSRPAQAMASNPQTFATTG